VSDLLIILDAPSASLRLAVCTARSLSQDASRRHQLADGSAGVLAQALTGALLLAATDDQGGGNVSNSSARVDVQLDCEGPLRGLLVDADANGAVRGLVRVNGLDRFGHRAQFDVTPEGDGAFQSVAQPFAGARAGADLQFQPMQPLVRFDPTKLLGIAGDFRAGSLSVLRALPGDESLHRAHVPFSGSDLGAGLSAFLRTERKLAGSLSLEVLFQHREPLAAVAGVILLPTEEDQRDQVAGIGEVLRAGLFHEALLEVEAGSPGNAHALANRLAKDLNLGPVRIESELRPRFSCRCSRARVVNALQTLGAAELRDMAGKDGGAEATCDFCAEVYRIGAAELIEMADEQTAKQ
jgi:molecular chaperone Hsp33